MKVKLIKMWEDEDLTPEEVSDLITRNDVWEVTGEENGIYALYTERDGVGEEAWVPCECVLEVE